MERFLLYLDDLDDIVHALAFVGERRGQGFFRALVNLIFLVSALAGIFIASHEPALAAGIMALLSVFLLYRSATTPYPSRQLVPEAR